MSELNNINNVLNLDLTKFYLEKQDSINCDLIYPVPKTLVDVEGKKLCDLINIESFKSFNIIEQNNPKTIKPFCTRCCSIF